LKPLSKVREKSQDEISSALPVPPKRYQTLGPRDSVCKHCLPTVASRVFQLDVPSRDIAPALSHLSFAGRAIDKSNVGPAEGATLGLPEGSKDGGLVGWSLGCTEGVSDGTDEGKTDGVDVGISEGVADGALDGSLLGIPVGAIEGSIDGTELGSIVGE
jgi:hypothetical protein